MRRIPLGFTLIELLIAVSVIAVLAAIAIPAYQNMVTRSHRAEATTLLMNSAQALERCYTRFYAYNDARCTANPVGRTSEGGFYQITAASTIEATAFTLVAAPQGRQVRDTDCGSFTLDQSGRRGLSDENADPDQCW